MNPKRRSISLLIGVLFNLTIVYGQALTGTSVVINDITYGSNSDYTAIQRVDSQPDRTHLRIYMGDEYTSDFEIGYAAYWDGSWNPTFTLDGNGNNYIKGNVGIGTFPTNHKLSLFTSSDLDGMQISHVNGKWIKMFSPSLTAGAYH